MSKQFSSVVASRAAQRWGRRWLGWPGWPVLGVAVLVGWPGAAGAMPPCYKSFERPQVVAHQPAPEDLLRIWLVFVDQGDGILIQLPPRFVAPGPDGVEQPVEVLVDAGSFFASDRVRMARFLARLLPEGPERIEHVVVTHHDGDHVSGLAACLAEERFSFGTVYHNGLASYVPEVLTADAEHPGSVRLRKRGATEREMAFFDAQDRLREDDLVEDLERLRELRAAGSLHGVYDELARALLEREAGSPADEFRRVRAGGPFVDPGAPSAPGPALSFELLWPAERARHFSGWPQTINGNSVTFRLVYGDFSMLFTGDQNDRSEAALMAALGVDAGIRLEADVLKVPHHGSQHNEEAFFDAVDPVLGVASMGRMGFGVSWKHPSRDIVRWLGGPHRAYHTFAHETHVRWDEIERIEDSAERAAEIARLRETTHVLVETDGRLFRVVEVPAPFVGDAEPGPLQVPTVVATRRGDGTRWIDARAAAGSDCP